MTRYAITHIGKDGLRTLTFPNQGRHMFDSMTAAVLALMEYQNGEQSIRRVIGDDGYASLEVRPVDCYDNGDAKGIYFPV